MRRARESCSFGAYVVAHGDSATRNSERTLRCKCDQKVEIVLRNKIQCIHAVLHSDIVHRMPDCVFRRWYTVFCVNNRTLHHAHDEVSNTPPHGRPTHQPLLPATGGPTAPFKSGVCVCMWPTQVLIIQSRCVIKRPSAEACDLLVCL